MKSMLPRCYSKGDAQPHLEGNTVDEARKNLQEALALFFETASSEEIKTRLHEEIYVTQVEVALG
jgi:predicted RNase H-like HicB family nuclease